MEEEETQEVHALPSSWDEKEETSPLSPQEAPTLTEVASPEPISSPVLSSLPPPISTVHQRKLPSPTFILPAEEKQKKKGKKEHRYRDADNENSSSSSSSTEKDRKKKKQKERKGKSSKRRNQDRKERSDSEDSSSSSFSSFSSSSSSKSSSARKRKSTRVKRSRQRIDLLDKITTRLIFAGLVIALIGFLYWYVQTSSSEAPRRVPPSPEHPAPGSLDAATLLLQNKKPVVEENDESFTMNRLRRNTELRFYVDKSVLAQRTQPLALVKNVTNLVRGYARALSMCATLSSALGVTGAMQTIPGSEERKLDDLYLSSSSAYSPFFCMNVPISAIVHTSDVRARDEQQLRDVREAGGKMPIFPIDADIVDQIARMASQTLQMASISWQQLTAPSYVAALHTEASRSSIASSPIHTANALGYSINAFFARDLEVLGHLSEPESLLQMVPYDYFPDVGRLVFGDHQNAIVMGTTACVCGLHLGIPRNLAFYFDSQAPHGRVTLEPVITQGGRSASQGPVPLITTQALPWANQLSDERHGVSAAYAVLDEALRSAAGLTGGAGFPATNKITIDSMRLPWTNQRHLENLGQRVLRSVDGSEALCIQYCQHLAYALRIKALELPPSERNMTRNGGMAAAS